MNGGTCYKLDLNLIELVGYLASSGKSICERLTFSRAVHRLIGFTELTFDLYTVKLPETEVPCFKM